MGNKAPKQRLRYALINLEPNLSKNKRSLRSQHAGFKRYWPWLFILLAWWLGEHFRLVINQTESLPQKVWLLRMKQIPKRYDYIAFRPPPKSNIPEPVILHKQVLGIPGDVITRQNRDFLINGQCIARAKTHSLSGEPLTVGPIGLLPEGQYYVSTPHPDSFDSRYDKMGWIPADHILGVLYPLW